MFYFDLDFVYNSTDCNLSSCFNCTTNHRFDYSLSNRNNHCYFEPDNHDSYYNYCISQLTNSTDFNHSIDSIASCSSDCYNLSNFDDFDHSCSSATEHCNHYSTDCNSYFDHIDSRYSSNEFSHS